MTRSPIRTPITAFGCTVGIDPPDLGWLRPNDAWLDQRDAGGGNIALSVVRITRCRLCNSPSLVSVLDLGEHALTGVFPESSEQALTRGTLELLWCRECTLVQLAHSYDPVEMYGGDYGYRSGLNATMVQHLARKAVGLESLVALGSDDVVLDIGSNDGTLLGSYATSPLRRVGIDPTAERFASFYPPGVEVVPEFFSADRYHAVSGVPARVITSIAMFYDLEDPVAFARDVRECLAPDGVWHFEQSYMPSMLRSTAYDTVCHEHLEYYALGTVRQILDEAHLELIDVRFNRVNGGRLAVTAAHKGASITPNRALIDWLSSSPAWGSIRLGRSAASKSASSSTEQTSPSSSTRCAGRVRRSWGTEHRPKGTYCFGLRARPRRH